MLQRLIDFLNNQAIRERNYYKVLSEERLKQLVDVKVWSLEANLNLGVMEELNECQEVMVNQLSLCASAGDFLLDMRVEENLILAKELDQLKEGYVDLLFEIDEKEKDLHNYQVVMEMHHTNKATTLKRVYALKNAYLNRVKELEALNMALSSELDQAKYQLAHPLPTVSN